ncbi:MAG: outer membrane lipoprotein chaperone LolA [Pseudomonadota bacterium]|nr:outer membrane lipoprotein chaperone LolA [Pseudomonadota bacterium]
MRYLMSIVSGMLVSSVCFAAPVDNLQKNLASFKSMRANFQQALYTEAKKPARKSAGKMAILRPGKFRWETKSPNDQVLIANGKTLWIYDVDLEQATKQPIDVTDSNSPALFLSGEIGEIPKRFTVTEDNTREGDVFKLRAKDREDMFQTLEITFNKSKLAKMTVETRLGQRSEFKFNNVELNPAMTTKLFEFRPPRGVDVIKNG